MQTADIYQFPNRPDGEVREKRGPQVEDGYTRIANELYEVVNNGHSCPVNVRHLRIIHALIRRTYGFNKTMDAVADTQLAADTGIPRNKVNVAKHELIAMNVIRLSDDGRKLGINKDYASWDFTKRPEKKAPKPKTKMGQNGNGVTKMVTSDVTNSGTHKRQKDSNTSTDVEERIGEPKREAAVGQDSKPEPKLPDCPHMEIIDLWAEIMPDKPQPSKNMWQGTERARHLAARWKAGFKIKHERTGEPLYTDLQSGLDWWGRFFRFLRKSEFLMGDNRWFKLAWVAKRENFVKIMEMDYHDGGES
ncbi:replication protein [Halomonas sp. 5021]|uniref:replication protein n=1 Tax=Halomonas sp. 5021 TaxID=3082156 RepID=UPI002FCA0406